jgi:hypothetical protein
VAVRGVLGLVEAHSVICRRGNAQVGSMAEAHVGGEQLVAVGRIAHNIHSIRLLDTGSCRFVQKMRSQR